MRRIFRCGFLAGVVSTIMSPAHAQQLAPGWPIAVAQYYARSKECWARYAERRLKTFTEATNCEDGGLTDSLSLAGYPHMDLVRVVVTEHLVIAERVDKKKITVAEGMAARAALESRMVAELQRRDLLVQKMKLEAAEAYARVQVQSEAEARSHAVADEQGRILDQMQAQAIADAEAARRAEALNLAGRLLSPQYVAPTQPNPSQTICQRVGFQLICNSN
jgi:hypothetical protein